ncbi:aldose epimerase family protein [Geodermatophilus poikilotrophus]|uniref:Aldose 1-epimerase n=1 Tax=Geodermatophilus poikilotrophus TaxID=1333667 RepID=A0A1I0DPS3_9ACTN|nr:aldose epimerase family protein [Geodermatophilus poikilotrophus]SET34369.1 aldose 1-epimerase [Geodermatophilus poikilotrophus]
MPGHPQPAAPPRSARPSRRRRRSLVAVLGAGLLTGGLAAPAGATDDRDRDAGGAGSGPSTSVEPFGATPDGTAVERWTLSNGDTTMRVLTFGGVIHTLEVPDADGEVENVVLGHPDLEGYYTEGDPYFGSLIGRYGNRIAGGRFTLDGQTYQLPLNDGPNTLHGGPGGFSERVWTATDVSDDEVAALQLELVSEDGDQGFPGTLTTTVTYRLDAESRLTVHYQATTDAPTVVNLTQHTYWNLAGEGSGDIYDHELQLNASGYTPVDETLIPTGEVAPVEGTPFDFREPTPIGARIRVADQQLLYGQGYDHNWALDREDDGAREGSDSGDALEEAAVLHDPDSGRTLTISTTEPGIQFYSGNFLDGTLVGTGGGVYRQGDGLALETQHAPDSPNQPEFPSTVLRPGEVYDSTTVFELTS